VSRKINVSQLKPGMYISELGLDWRSHNFLRSSFAVKNDEVIRRIVESGMHEVYIDPARGLDVADAPTDVEVEAAVEQEMVEVALHLPPPPRITASEEMPQATLISAEACAIVRAVMNHARLGLQVQAEQVDPIVNGITGSILRNGHALLYLTRIKSKDDYTFQHSVAVCSLLVAFGRALGMDAETLHLAGIGGLLHDVGKVHIDDAILNKPGPLSRPQFERMKDHVTEGVHILRQSNSFHPTSILVVQHHHERYDGSGYAGGLVGEAISQMGQMAAICDVYDAITSQRIYSRPMSPHQATAKIFEWGKGHFNPTLVQQFLRVIGIYPVGALVKLESGRLAIVLEQSESSLLKPVVRAFYDTRHRRVIPAVEIDLSRPLGQGGGDRIVSHETAENWGLNPARFV
jgi:putative nucleotidyltransferase with HDIG domain